LTSDEGKLPRDDELYHGCQFCDVTRVNHGVRYVQGVGIHEYREPYRHTVMLRQRERAALRALASTLRAGGSAAEGARAFQLAFDGG
jgi:hypothetical protein